MQSVELGSLIIKCTQSIILELIFSFVPINHELSIAEL